MSILPKHSLIPHFGIPFFFLLIFVNGQLLQFVNGQKNKGIGGGPIKDYAENKDILEENVISRKMFAQIDNFKDDVDPEDKAEWVPGYRNEANRIEGGYNKRKTYYAMDGTCGVLLNGNEYGKPQLSFAKSKDINGLPKSKHQNNCIKDFHNANFGPICGNPNYDYDKHCSMVHFFDNKLPENSDMVNGDKQDMLLVLIDGCAVCENREKASNELKLELSISHVLPAGSIFTKCKEKENEAGKADGIRFHQVNNDRIFANTQFGRDYKSDGYGASFVMPAMFYQRHCMGLFSEDEMHTTFTGLKLKIKHNCGGDGQEFTADLPDLETSSYEYHIAEMRGVMLDLGERKVRLMERISRAKNEYSEKLRWQNWIQDVDESPEEAKH